MDRQRLARVREKMAWMRREAIWPNGLRYLWTDAFGVVLLVSLYRELGEDHWLNEARRLVDEVERVLGRQRGIRIGEEPDRDGQYFHYLGMWLFALARLGEVDESYRQRGVELVHEIHDAFVVPGVGVVWKMQEDLTQPYPGYGYGALDAFHGYVSYRMLDEEALAPQIRDMKLLMEDAYRNLTIDQDLGLGIMLWLSHFFPDEPWARLQKARSLHMLDIMWRNEGYFCRQPQLPYVKFAFTNYGVSIGLQAVSATPERVVTLQNYFEDYHSGDDYDRDAITHVMSCSSWCPGALLRDFRHDS